MSSREGHSRRGCARKRAGMGNEERTLPGKGEAGGYSQGGRKDK